MYKYALRCNPQIGRMYISSRPVQHSGWYQTIDIHQSTWVLKPVLTFQSHEDLLGAISNLCMHEYHCNS